MTVFGGIEVELESTALELIDDEGTLVEVETQTLVLLEPEYQLEVDSGLPGPSAYQLAVANGFVGTQLEWLASLRGASGPIGGTYVHTQVNASLTPLVQHNLGYRPAGVRAYSELGNEIGGLVTYINDAALVVTFLEPFAGSIYVS